MTRSAPPPLNSLLKQLELLRLHYGELAAADKALLVQQIGVRSFSRPELLVRYHEILCWMAAYPDHQRLLSLVRGELKRFGARADVARHREALRNSGIAGTDMHYRFFWMMARWLAKRAGGQLQIDWTVPYFEPGLRAALPLFLGWSRAEAAKRSTLPLRQLIDHCRASDPYKEYKTASRTDAVWLTTAIERLPGDDFTRERLHDSIDPAYVLTATPHFASRTLAYHQPAPLVFRRQPPQSERPVLSRELARAPLALTRCAAPMSNALLDLARQAMLTRERDLAAFSWGDARDVMLIDDGDGLSFALIGSLPQRRLPLAAVHGWLMLRNRVPIGYVQTDSLLHGTEVAFNLFPSFRGGEAAYLFARVLAVARWVLGARAFSIEPYQLGVGNDEGIASGAWWFYYKLGFRPIALQPQQVLARELARIHRQPLHRSSERVLRQLAAGHLVFEPDQQYRAWLPWMPGLGLAAELACEEDANERALRRFKVANTASWSVDEKLAWRRFAPVLMALDGVNRWNEHDKQTAVSTIRAKGGRRELSYLKQFNRHAALGRSLIRLLQTSEHIGAIGQDGGIKR